MRKVLKKNKVGRRKWTISFIIFSVLRVAFIIICGVLAYHLFMKYQSSFSDLMFRDN